MFIAANLTNNIIISDNEDDKHLLNEKKKIFQVFQLFQE